MSLIIPGKIILRNTMKRFHFPGIINSFPFSILSIATAATVSGFITDHRPIPDSVWFRTIWARVVFIPPGQIVLTLTFFSLSSRRRLLEKARRYDFVPPYTCLLVTTNIPAILLTFRMYD